MDCVNPAKPSRRLDRGQRRHCLTRFLRRRILRPRIGRETPMADGSVAGVAALKGKVSAEEWQVRVELAALYRLVALYGWDDLIYTHISARIPGPEHHFLINPYGLLFEEMTAL